MRDYHARTEAATGGEPCSNAASKIGVARNADFSQYVCTIFLSGLIFGAVYEVFRDLAAKEEIAVVMCPRERLRLLLEFPDNNSCLADL